MKKTTIFLTALLVLAIASVGFANPTQYGRHGGGHGGHGACDGNGSTYCYNR